MPANIDWQSDGYEMDAETWARIQNSPSDSSGELIAFGVFVLAILGWVCVKAIYGQKKDNSREPNGEIDTMSQVSGDVSLSGIPTDQELHEAFDNSVVQSDVEVSNEHFKNEQDNFEGFISDGLLREIPTDQELYAAFNESDEQAYYKESVERMKQQAEIDRMNQMF